MSSGQDSTLPLQDFDRELSLDELLGGIDLNKLRTTLDVLLTASYRLVSLDDCVVLGDEQMQVGKRVPVRHEIETVAYLELQNDVEVRQHAAIVLLEMLFKSGARYLMASNLHLQAMHADYEKLQQNHVALQESEARYRVLSENLEQRVEEQVRAIDLTQRQLYQAEKMASVGQLAAGVAHEINNPIGFINSNLSTAKTYIKQLMAFVEALRKGTEAEGLKTVWQANSLDFVMEDFPVMLNESIDGAERVAKIVNDLRDFSNVDRSDEEFVNLNDTIRSVCNIVRSELSRHAELDMELGELPMTRCYPGHLSQALLNILLNAGQAMQKSGKVSIATEFLVRGQGGAGTGEIFIRIADNGVGMPQEILGKVFDPFYTSREVGEGAGLGLTVCHDIVQSHEGRIDIDSQPGKGTTVNIYLPVRAK